MKDIKVRVYIDGIQIPINKETSFKCSQWCREGVSGSDNGGNVTNIQYKSK
jgi:hypothetical protein